MKQINFYGKSLNAYRASLHAHSTVSDGFFSPEQVVKLYEEAGYDILALTDHAKKNDFTKLSSTTMTLLPGIELHPGGPRVPWHLVCLGIPQNFPEEFSIAQEAVAAVNAAGGVVFNAHPYWCGFDSREVESLKGTLGIEVYNGGCRALMKEYNMQCWDEMLNHGCFCTAIAVDDMHRPRDLFWGWTMICAPDRDQKSILKALRQGEFYASTGPEIYSLEYVDGVFRAEFSEVTDAVLISNLDYYWCETLEDLHYRGEGIRPITTLVCNVREKFPVCTYARLQIRDARGYFAWSNPIRLDNKEVKSCFGRFPER